MSNDARPSSGDQMLFWGCFIALITTAFAFITRAFMVNDPALWPATFGLDEVQAGELFGAGIWPFAISIIVFSLVIDRIGYKTAMYFSFVCYAIYAALAIAAYGMVSGAEGEAMAEMQDQAYWLLYAGSVILGLGNGTVEAFINPVVATMFRRDKTKWLNILHAGWPGGLVLAGVLTIALSQGDAGGWVGQDWRVLIYLIAIPAVVYLVMLVRADFPVTERVKSGTTYREMLAEFGACGALLASVLIFSQLGQVFGFETWLTWTLVGASTLGFWAYCRSLGRPILIFLCLVMMPLAITELGTDGAITGIMAAPLDAAGYSPLWVLVYTSAIMAVLRFWFAGPIVTLLTPVGLLIASSFLAIVGLYFLSGAQGLAVIFLFATLYGLGKTFFWPTMLGVVSEQCPKGGALTLNAIAGIGMLSVGIIGAPWIGKMAEDSIRRDLDPEVYAEIQDDQEKSYVLGRYTAHSEAKLEALPEGQKSELEKQIAVAKQKSLATVTIFPMVMLASYILLALYFRSRGGYKTVDLKIEGEDAGP